MVFKPLKPKHTDKRRPYVPLADRAPVFDDLGDPIPEAEISRERNRSIPPGFPNDLVPDISEDCTDDEWDRAMLIEQIKFRRRTAKPVDLAS